MWAVCEPDREVGAAIVEYGQDGWCGRCLLSQLTKTLFRRIIENMNRIVEKRKVKRERKRLQTGMAWI